MKTGISLLTVCDCGFPVGQFCGISIIAYYSSAILVRAGFADRSALAAALGFGAVNCAASALLPCTRLLERVGRRLLLLSALPLMALCLAGVAISFAAIPARAPTTSHHAADSTSHLAAPSASMAAASHANITRFTNGGDRSGGGNSSAGGLDALPHRNTVRAACGTLGIYLFGVVHALGAGAVPAVYAAEVFAPAVRVQGVGIGQLPASELFPSVFSHFYPLPFPRSLPSDACLAHLYRFPSFANTCF